MHGGFSRSLTEFSLRRLRPLHTHKKNNNTDGAEIVHSSLTKLTVCDVLAALIEVLKVGREGETRTCGAE